jgi:lysyl-tRNA synthetase class II
MGDEEISDDRVAIAGRVYTKRIMGKNLTFLDIHSQSEKIQVIASTK